MTHEAKNFEVTARRDIAQEENTEDVTEHLPAPPSSFSHFYRVGF